MLLDNESQSLFFKKYRNLIIAGILSLILIVGAIMAFTDWFGRWIDWRKIEKLESNINAELINANAINANLQQLANENADKSREVNSLIDNYNRSKEATNEAQRNAKRALDNLNAIERRNFNGTDSINANRARCRAFPDSPECRP